MPPSQIDTALAGKVVSHLNTAYSVLCDATLSNSIYDLSSGRIPGRIAVIAGTPLECLLEDLAPIPLATPKCIIVSGANEPKLCEKCRGHGLTQCALKVPMNEQQLLVPTHIEAQQQTEVIANGYQPLQQPNFTFEEIAVTNYTVSNYTHPFVYHSSF